ncbi:MAG: MutS-related protein [Terriglobia bacterium]
MDFHSILFARTGQIGKTTTSDMPAFFIDLHLDQIVDAVTSGREEYDLKPFFYAPLTDVDSIAYRHEVIRDLENLVLFGRINAFAQNMRTVRKQLAHAEKLHYPHQKKRWLLDAIELYCDAVSRLACDLTSADMKSRGFIAFRTYLTGYTASDRFNSLSAETTKLVARLAEIKYCVLIKGDAVTVRKYESEQDYSAEVEETFRKFRQDSTKDYRVDFPDTVEMNHIEAQILDFVARLYPEIFSDLDGYCARNGNFMDDTTAVFDREIQFYFAWLEHVAPFKRAGLQFCYPQVSDRHKEIRSHDGFDLALARKLVGENTRVVCNNFHLDGDERILVVSGPNQGGKTTFARTFGQLHYLASLGCTVPGSEARLFLFDKLFTHFEKEEDIETLRGKLEEDLTRIHDILTQATPNSIVIMNEIFTSTTLQDQIFLSEKIMARIVELDALCAWVTFIDEVASSGTTTVSMVSSVVPENPALRTYKLERRPADGLAYAMSIAEKYRVTYDHLKKRLKA